MTPNLFEALTKTDRGEAALRLIEPFSLSLEAEKLDLSISDFSMVCRVALRGEVEVDQPIQTHHARSRGGHDPESERPGRHGAFGRIGQHRARRRGRVAKRNRQANGAGNT